MENIYQKKWINVMKKKSLLLILLHFLFVLISFESTSAQNNLNYYINAAKKNSPLIAENQNQSKANTLEIERLKAVYTKPQIGLTANYLLAPILITNSNKIQIVLNPTTADKYYGYDLSATNGGQYQALININQPLLANGRYKTAKELSDIDTKINENNIVLTSHDIEKAVTDQYILCWLDSQQINFVKQMMEFITNQKKILEKLVNSSIYKLSDLSLLNIEYQNNQLQLATLKINYQNHLMDLNILCGLNDSAIIPIQQPEITTQIENQDSAFLTKFSLDSSNLKSQQSISELKYKPQLNAFLNSGLNANNYRNLSNRLGLSMGLSFSYTIFDGKQKLITRSKTQLLQNTIEAYRENFQTQNTIRKVKIKNELISYNERTLLIENQLKEYDIILNNYKKEILSGQLSIINYITTLKNKSILQKDFALLNTQKLLLTNTFNYWNW